MLSCGSTTAASSVAATTLGGQFVLDTCFVVSDIVEMDNRHFAEQVAGRVPEAFMDATLRPIFKG